MKTYKLAFLGFGNVGRALVQLLESKRAELRESYGIEFAITGVASRRLGWHSNPAGYSAADLNGDATAFTARGTGRLIPPGEADLLAGLKDWLAACQADVLFENTSMNPHTGQPAIDYIRTALQAGVHVVTANKGPVVHAYHELRELAAANRVRFLFEAAVMGGAPIFSLFREALPAARLQRFRGILNSTTNLILTEMENGSSFEAAVGKAQDLGIAETDPSFDVDGWDATVKVSALATVLMDFALKPQDIVREGIRGLTTEQVQSAKMTLAHLPQRLQVLGCTRSAGVGSRYKLAAGPGGEAAGGTVVGSVKPELIRTPALAKRSRCKCRRRPAGWLRRRDFHHPVPDGRHPQADALRNPPGCGDHGVWAAGGFHHHSAQRANKVLSFWLRTSAAPALLHSTVSREAPLSAHASCLSGLCGLRIPSVPCNKRPKLDTAPVERVYLSLSRNSSSGPNGAAHWHWRHAQS